MSQRLGDYIVNWEHVFDKQQRNLTIAEVYDSEKRLLAKGRAIKSEKDQTSKKIARKVALAKAIKNTHLAKEERRKIWEGYRTEMTKTPRWHNENKKQ